MRVNDNKAGRLELGNGCDSCLPPSLSSLAWNFRRETSGLVRPPHFIDGKMQLQRKEGRCQDHRASLDSSLGPRTR